MRYTNDDDTPTNSDDIEYSYEEESMTDSLDEEEHEENVPSRARRVAKKKKKKSTIIHEGSDKPLAVKERHYVNNKDFLEAMKKRKIAVQEALAAGKPKPKISDYIGVCILQIANNLGKKKNFARYGYKEEMISDAVVVCINYLDNFNPDISSNPFSYFTQVCNYAFINRISYEKKQQYVKYKQTLSSILHGELADIGDDKDNAHLFDNVRLETEFMTEFVDDYEKKKSVQVVVEKQEATGLEAFVQE